MGPVLPSFLGRARELGTCALVVLSSAGCGAASGEVTAAGAVRAREVVDASGDDAEVAGEDGAADDAAPNEAMTDLASLAPGPSEPLGVAATEVLEASTAEETASPNAEDHEDAHRTELRAWLAFQRAEDARHASFDGLVIEADNLEALLVEVRSTIRLASAIEGDYRRTMGSDRTRIVAGLVHAGRVWERVAGAFLVFEPSWSLLDRPVPPGITLLDDGSAPPWAPPGGTPHPATEGTRPILDRLADEGECRALANYLLATRVARHIVHPGALTVALVQEARERLATYPDPQITQCMDEERRSDPTIEPYVPGEYAEEPSA